MPLNTVKMVAKKIICSYDTNGAKIAEREELIPQVYHDLPHTTALAYMTKFPDNQVQVVAQHGEIGAVKSSYSSSPREYTTGRRFERTPSPKRPAAKQDAGDDLRAAQTGDMAAAINAEIGS